MTSGRALLKKKKKIAEIKKNKKETLRQLLVTSRQLATHRSGTAGAGRWQRAVAEQGLLLPASWMLRAEEKLLKSSVRASRSSVIIKSRQAKK